MIEFFNIMEFKKISYRLNRSFDINYNQNNDKIDFLIK